MPLEVFLNVAIGIELKFHAFFFFFFFFKFDLA